MRRHVPSKPDDLDFDVRELAKAAARREGVSLEEWAATVLTGPDDRREPFPAQVRRTDDIDSILSRMARTARSRHPAGDDLAFVAATGSEGQARDRQEKEQASRTAVALKSMAIWIEGAEERLNEAARASADHQDRIASFLSQALSALKDRLDTVERHVVSERAAPPRIEFPLQDALRALAPLSETLLGLRADMSRLTLRLDPPSPDWAKAVESVRTEIEGLKSAMGSLASREDIAALAGAMSDLARDLEPGRPNMDLRTLARSIAALYGQVQILTDEIAEGVHRRIGGEISPIKSRIEALASQIVDMRQELVHRAEPHPVARLSDDMATLGRQMADLRANQVGRGDFSALKASLENVCSALSGTVAAQGTGIVPEQIRHPSQRLDGMVSRPEPASLDSIAEQLALLTEGMVRLSSSHREQADTLDRVSSQVEAVARRELPSQEPLMQRFDRIEGVLRQVGDTAGASRVEAMLRSINEKLERVPVASRIDGIDQPITAPGERFAREPLDKASPEAQFRNLQEEAAGIAERAARAVLKDIGSMLPDPNDIATLKQGLVELKALQAATDAKTQQSLRALHEVLETLVARFPGQAPASPPALGRAPILPARSAERLPPADRLEAAVRRLHAAAQSPIEEASSGYPVDSLTGASAAFEAGKTMDPHAPRSGASLPSPETDLGSLRASLIAAARRAAQNSATVALDRTAHNKS